MDGEKKEVIIRNEDANLDSAVSRDSLSPFV
jgi:hypothetical protein